MCAAGHRRVDSLRYIIFIFVCVYVFNVKEGQVIECSQVSDIREGISPKVKYNIDVKNVFLRFLFRARFTFYVFNVFILPTFFIFKNVH